MWEILSVDEKVGIQLLDSGSMWPAASVSGMIFHHPESCYFAINRVANDQLDDYAKRVGHSTEDVERRLPNLL